MAGELGEALLAHRIERGGRIVFADDTGVMVSPDYAVGTSGIGSFFHRLATGGPRDLMVDDILDAHVAREGTAAGAMAGR
jgi:hypothetical protein